MLESKVQELEKVVLERDMEVQALHSAHDAALARLRRELATAHQQLSECRAEAAQLLMSKEVAEQHAQRSHTSGDTHDHPMIAMLQQQVDEAAARMRASEQAWSRRLADAHAHSRSQATSLTSLEAQLVDALQLANLQEAERERLEDELARAAAAVTDLRAQLSNSRFVSLPRMRCAAAARQGCARAVTSRVRVVLVQRGARTRVAQIRAVNT